MAVINNSKKIKQKHLNKGKIHLNQKGVRILGDIYLREISKIFNWYETGNCLKSHQLVLMNELTVRVF